MLNLGDLARDRISGLEGVVVGRAEYLFGCVQLCLRPQTAKEGKPAEGTWFDRDQLELVRTHVIRTVEAAPVAVPGGPAVHPLPPD